MDSYESDPTLDTSAVLPRDRRVDRSSRGRASRVALPALKLFLVGAVLGLSCGLIFWMRLSRTDVAFLPYVGDAKIEVVGDARQGSFGYSAECKTTLEGKPVRIMVSFPADVDRSQIVRGASFTCGIKIQPFEHDEWGHRLFRSAIAGSGSTYSCEYAGFSSSAGNILGRFRAECRKRLLEGGKGSELLPGLILGDKQDIAGTKQEEAFRRAGLSHIIAISGTHLALIAALVDRATHLLPLRRRMKATILLVILLLFTLATGANPSTLRALFMSGTGMVAQGFGRRKEPLSAVMLCVVVFLGVHPSFAFDVGFTLSVLAVGGILLLSPLFKQWITESLSIRGRDHLRTRPARFAADALSLTFAAQTTTLPVTIPVFEMVSLVSPLSNLVAVPFLTAALSVGVFALVISFVCHPAGTLLTKGAAFLAYCGSTIAAWCAKIPYAAISAHGNGLIWGAITLALLVSLWALWPKPSKRFMRLAVAALVVILLLLSLRPTYSKDRIVMLDVGQGDATLIQSQGHTLLIDTGPDPQKLQDELLKLRVKHIDALIITHLHDDHYGGFGGISNTVAIDALYLPAGALQKNIDPLDTAVVHEFQREAPKTPAAELKAGDHLSFGNAELTVLSPAEYVDPSENESSVVALIRIEGIDVLVTGDAESDVIEEILRDENKRKQIGDIEVLKVGHHGSAKSLTPFIVDTIKPDVALIGVGARNSFGHPTKTALDLLRRSLCTIYRTDQNGDIEVQISGDHMRVMCEKGE